MNVDKDYNNKNSNNDAAEYDNDSVDRSNDYYCYLP